MFQTAIVGAGVAGLAAGRELLRHGGNTVVIEARERVGGRVHTVCDALSPLPAELGAEMVHGLSPVLWDVLREAAATAVEMTGTHLVRDKAGLHGASEFEEMNGIFERMAQAPEQSFLEFLATVHAPAEVKRAATGYVEGFNAAHKEDVSISWLNRENAASEEVEGDRAFRVVQGYSVVPAYLSRGLDVRLSTAVRRIRWRKGAVTVETDKGEFHSRTAIIALPLAVLRAGAVAIDPVPKSLTAAFDAIATGDAVRLMFRFREAPWAKHPRLSFLHSDEPFPVWWTAHPLHAPMITGWAAGPRAKALRGMDRECLVRTAMESLRRILGEEFEPPEAFWFHDWIEDPFARGAYSYVRVNGSEAQKSLTLPIEDTLCFAGEALDLSGHTGTVHGAMTSGIAAARALLKAG